MDAEFLADLKQQEATDSRLDDFYDPAVGVRMDADFLAELKQIREDPAQRVNYPAEISRRGAPYRICAAQDSRMVRRGLAPPLVGVETNPGPEPPLEEPEDLP